MKNLIVHRRTLLFQDKRIWYIAESLTVESKKKPYGAHKKALFLSNFLIFLVLVCICFGMIKRKEFFYVRKYSW